MNFIENLNLYRKKIDLELKKFFDEQIRESKRISRFTEEIMRYLKEFCLEGGKRIRPIFFISGYKCIKGENNDAIIKASISAELIHASMLIHDDVIDKDSLRRNKPTFHKIYEGVAKKEKLTKEIQALDFGENMAILGGDILFALANRVLASNNFYNERKSAALERLNTTLTCTGFGQVLDLVTSIDRMQNISEDDILNVYVFKTAKYTVEGPLHIGAILGNANSEDLKILSEYAIPVGQAFQIQDDILGIFGDEKKLGKPIGSDIKEGKKTLPILKALEKANETQKADIISALRNPQPNNRVMENVRKIIIDTGALDYSKNLANQLIEKAKNIIRKSNFKSEGKDLLIGMADYLANRDF